MLLMDSYQYIIVVVSITSLLADPYRATAVFVYTPKQYKQLTNTKVRGVLCTYYSVC